MGVRVKYLDFLSTAEEVVALHWVAVTHFTLVVLSPKSAIPPRSALLVELDKGFQGSGRTRLDNDCKS